VSALAPNATSTGTTTITVPATTPVGTYVLLACADDTSTNVESNESNNCTASAGSVSVKGFRPRCCRGEQPTGFGARWGTFTVTDSTQNRGTAASAGSMTRYYLSIDRVKGTATVC
jgi:subtilase family serine protease